MKVDARDGEATECMNQLWSASLCIAEAFGVSARSIERWEENYTIRGCVNPPTSRSIKGHPKLLTADMIDDIQTLLDQRMAHSLS